MNEKFMENLNNVLKEEYNVSVTENGAIGYRTTGKKLLDINFSISSLRKASELEVAKKFEAVFLENKLLGVKWLFYAADVRGGVGERRLFRIGIKWLADAYPEVARAILPLVAEYTRWDNLFVLLETELKDDVIGIVKTQLNEDLVNLKDGKSISLLGKWMPSETAKNATTRKYAKILCSGLELTDRRYRKMLSKLRAYLKVVEVSMSKNEWNNIEYSAVPSRANLIYGKAFIKHDKERREEFLESLTKGETKINASVLFPHDIVHKYGRSGEDTVLEELWKALPDYVQGNGKTICVSDGSGSMTSRVGRNSTVSCLDVAISLAIYFSERCTGQFKNKYISFSESPQIVDLLENNTLRDKIRIARCYNEVANTNIEAVFDLVLDTAIKFHMTQEDLPDNILISSDMEFDECAESNDGYGVSQKLFDVIAKRYADAGYKLPRLVFWNIGSSTGTIPVKENELGVALVSGFSPAIVKMVLSNSTDPLECLLEQINSERYAAVEEALKDVIH